jgi:phosphate transport system protein
MARIVDPILQDLRAKALRMGALAEAILAKAVRSVWEHDAALASEVQHDDLEIDRLDVAIDDAVLRTLALQAPLADDLRRAIGIKMMATDLERVGDLARNIAKSAIRLAARPDVRIPPKLQELADESQRLLHRALDSFTENDARMAEGILVEDDQVDADQDEVIRAAIEDLRSHPEMSSQGVDFILIAKNLERVADHATNIAEDVILVTEARNVKHAGKIAS